jgi:hypothetical protein
VGVFGKEGATWLARLPRTLEEIAALWRLTLSPPFNTLSYNFVAPATTSEGKKVVLKVGVPSP